MELHALEQEWRALQQRGQRTFVDTSQIMLIEF
jgi:hypothetical protein